MKEYIVVVFSLYALIYLAEFHYFHMSVDISLRNLHGLGMEAIIAYVL